MLPFSKRKSPGEMELDDDDLVVIEEEIPVVIDLVEVQASPRNADQAKTLRRSTIPPPSMRPLDERVEDDVAGMCLASIAAEVRSPQSASGIRAIVAAAPVKTKTPDRELSASYTIPPAARLPQVTSPPFVRAQAAPGVRASTPPSAFARRSSSQFPCPVPAQTRGPTTAVHATNVISRTVEIPTVDRRERSSTAPPVAVSTLPMAIPASAAAVEPTVIVLRERPKTGWILASAAIGALCALAAAKLVTSSHDDAPAAAQSTSTTTIATAVMTGPSPAVQLPSAPTGAVAGLTPNPMLANPAPIAAPAKSASAPASATGAVVRFGDEQGVAIAAPKPIAPSTQPAAKPAAPKSPMAAPPAKSAKPVKSPMLPDGSFPLGQGESKSAAAPVAAPPPPITNTPSQAEKAAQAALASTILTTANNTNGVAATPAPEPPPPPRRRALTPEQQIAEAQLKASMK